MEKIMNDKTGKSRVTIEGDTAPINMPDNVVIANRPIKNTKTNPLMQDIGPKSNGFAGVATLAAIIAVAGVIIAFITLRY